MLIKDKQYRSIWPHPEKEDTIQIIDQRYLPHRLVIADISSVDAMCTAISDMWVRGAPLIGAAAAWGLYLATCEVPASCARDFFFEEAYGKLLHTRPTAVNLKHALDAMLPAITGNDSMMESKMIARRFAQHYADQDVIANSAIGMHGLSLIKTMHAKNPDRPVRIMTHCNAGWLATVDRGTATAPIYAAAEAEIPVHVFVSETRPRNQGANITAWELQENKIPCTVMVDNAAGYLLQNDLVDMVLTGTDRTSACGDVINKIGTYLKALAAKENAVPFYVAAPISSIDLKMQDAFSEAVIEHRSPDEVHLVQGILNEQVEKVRITPQGVHAVNPAFDITPAALVTGLITEKGVVAANQDAIAGLF